MTIKALTGAAALAMAASGGAVAQDMGGEPGFGALTYRGAPQSLPARAGGAASLEALGCPGYATLRPTVVVDVATPGPLFIAASSDTDLTLAVRGPDGAVTCADDEAGDLNPGAAFTPAEPGRYEVWAGTYGSAQGYPPITVNASPTGFDTSNPYTVAPDPKLAGGQRLRLRGGFRDDPRRLDVTAGGPAAMSALEAFCSGRTSPAPSAGLDFTGGDLPLFFLAEASEDATLAVVTPSGEVACADDTIGSHAGVRIDAPAAGRYAVFAGLFGDTERTAPATLSISEVGYGGADRRLDVAADPVFGAHELSAGFLPDPAAFPVRAGGPLDLSVSLSGDEFCNGYVTRNPSLRLRYDGSGPLFVSMESDEDTTLAVNGPDGVWSCDDDSLGDLNPAVRFDPARPGVYDIYAGAFFDGEAAEATVYLSERAPGADPSANVMNAALEAGVTVTLAPGFAPAAGRFEVTAGGAVDAMANGAADCPGGYANAPSVELTWDGGPLVLTTQGEADTTLAARLPDGRRVCDDDGGEGWLSRLELDGAPGVYDIWVGTFSGAEADATLQIEAP